MLLVTLPRLSQRLVLVVPTAVDSVDQISDYAAIFDPTRLLDQTILSSATSSSIPMDFSSSNQMTSSTGLLSRFQSVTPTILNNLKLFANQLSGI